MIQGRQNLNSEYYDQILQLLAFAYIGDLSNGIDM